VNVEPILAELKHSLARVATGEITLTLNQGQLVSVKEITHRRYVPRGEAPLPHKGLDNAK